MSIVTQPNEAEEREVRQPNTGPGAGQEQERFAGKPVDDPPFITEEMSAARNQTPEVEEFGERAVKSGDPDGEDRPNGDPRTVGRPVGGGDRGPDVSDRADAGDQGADDRA